MKLEPRLEHCPFVQDERRLNASGILEVFHHLVTLLA